MSKKTYYTVQQFRSKRSGTIYTVKLDEEGNLSCNCKGWIFKRGDNPRTCKHVRYVIGNNVQVRSPDGEKFVLWSEMTDIPTCEEAKKMDWGKNRAETTEWHNDHLKIIEL